MFKQLVTTATLILCVFCTQTYSELKYKDSYDLFREIMALGSILVTTAEKNDLEVVKVDIDLVGKGNPKQTLKKLSVGFNYAMVAVGNPSRIKDLDIKVYYITSDGQQILMAKDQAEESVAKVVFTPIASGTYLIIIEAYEMIPGYSETNGYYFLCIEHD